MSLDGSSFRFRSISVPLIPFGQVSSPDSCSAPAPPPPFLLPLEVLTTAQAVFDVDFAHGLTLIEIADGVTVDEVKSKTGATFQVAKDLNTM